MTPIVIIGTGFAGYTLAREFRKLDSETPLLLVTSDDGRSYPKPMLSNALTKGKTADELALSDANAMAKTLKAEIVTNSVVSKIDPQAQVITFVDGKQLKYKQLVLAVGAKPIPINIKEIGDNAISINSLNDYSVFRAKLETANHVALIGPGLIGCEFANDLINVGKKVSVIGPDPYPMSSLLPKPIAEELKAKLAETGVNWYLETTVSEVNKHGSQGYKITLANGEVINADIIVSAIGLRPNIELADVANLDVAGGIMTDKFLQTSQPNIFALGDCAEVAGHNLLFIAPILVSARALANTLSGSLTAVKYPAMPVAIKTPAYPLVVSPPPHAAIGQWQFEPAPSGFGIKGLFRGEKNGLLGFVLSGDTLSEKQALAKQLPALLG
ncbi:MAG: FAD-dependent oxidoreductase [Methylophaga sp.]|nr:MAG: FAD-dependent oxidoreductase [Methylophaga sp.]